MRRLTGKFADPIFLASVASSAAGAAVMVVGSVKLGVNEFSGFSLAYLVLTIVLGVLRAGLLQPALMFRRREPGTLVPLRYVLICCATAGLASAVAFGALRAMSSLECAALGAFSALPVLFEWAKHRHMSIGSRPRVAVAEATRFVSVGFLALPPWPATTAALLAGIVLGYGIGFALLLVRFPRSESKVPFAAYRHEAVSQVADYGVAQMLSSVPLLIVGIAAPGLPLVGAIRFCQTVFGPLNVLFGAVSNSLMVSGARGADEVNDQQLARRGTRFATMTFALSVPLTAVLLIAATLNYIPSGVSAQVFPTAALLVGAVAIAASWSGMYMIVLRLVGEARAVLRYRLIVLAVTLGGYLLGAVLGDLGLSVALGFGGQALALGATYAVVAYRLSRWR